MAEQEVHHSMTDYVIPLQAICARRRSCSSAEVHQSPAMFEISALVIRLWRRTHCKYATLNDLRYLGGTPCILEAERRLTLGTVPVLADAQAVL